MLKQGLSCPCSAINTVLREYGHKTRNEGLKPHVWPWDCLVVIQCTKPPDVVKRTAELLAEEGHDAERWELKGQ